MHKSVLMQEVLKGFEGLSIGCFVDGTLGAGGHSETILIEHPEIQQLIGIDQDPQALKMAEERLAPFQAKLKLIHANFAQIGAHVKKADAILVDLGVSSMQLDQAEKGFSFMRDGPLDMRMNPKDPLSAKEIVNEWDEKSLARIFRDYGEEKRWRRAAQHLVQERMKKPIETTKELVTIMEPVLRDPRSKIHSCTRIFQALRIATNRELEVLETFLVEALKVLAPGGRLAVISFHSLEDRIVKHFFRTAASDKVSTSGIGGVFLDKKPEVKLISSKPWIASETEVSENPRSRSAKLRVIEKLP